MVLAHLTHLTYKALDHHAEGGVTPYKSWAQWISYFRISEGFDPDFDIKLQSVWF